MLGCNFLCWDKYELFISPVDLNTLSYFLHTCPMYSAVFSLPEGKMLSFFGIVPEGHILDIPNGYLGMIFYLYTIIRFYTVNNNKQQKPSILFTIFMNRLISTMAIASSIFLGRKLYLIRELCVVCVSTHIINTTCK